MSSKVHTKVNTSDRRYLRIQNMQTVTKRSRDYYYLFTIFALAFVEEQLAADVNTTAILKHFSFG